MMSCYLFWWSFSDSSCSISDLNWVKNFIIVSWFLLNGKSSSSILTTALTSVTSSGALILCLATNNIILFIWCICTFIQAPLLPVKTWRNRRLFSDYEIDIIKRTVRDNISLDLLQIYEYSVKSKLVSFIPKVPIVRSIVVIPNLNS